MSDSEQAEPPRPRLGVVILAAGQGTRMRSPIPKVLHPIAGQPMLSHVLRVTEALGAAVRAVVVAPDQPAVRSSLSNTLVIEQSPQLGTGHAVLQAREALAGRCERVLVLFGDTPLIRPETAERLLEALDGSSIAILTTCMPDPNGYGRIVRGATGRVLKIVEQVEADAETLKIQEINSGLMAFKADWLWDRLARLPVRSKGEYYLTDLVEQALAEGHPVAAVLAEEADEVLGINSQAQLAQANREAWNRETERLMAEGVTILDPLTTYVEPGVVVGPGTVVHPNTHLKGKTRIGRECQIGPDSTVVDSVVGDACRIWASIVEGSDLESEVQVGPWSHVRPGSYLEREVYLGNFAETKASHLGRGTQQHHFSYLGDAEVGAHVNVGAGSITCNFDGEKKHRTVIGEDAFIGSDSMLVAPVTIGARAHTGAGSVVTRDVPDDGTVIGVPARPFERSASQPQQPARPPRPGRGLAPNNGE